ncbi:MAG: response regulator transcription factor, partial [Nocardioidaceae bacterium]
TAAAAALEGHRAAARVGLGGSTGYLAVTAGYHLLLQGDLARVDQLVREVLAGRPVGSPGVQTRVLAVMLAVRRDDLDLAARHWSALEHDCPAWRERPGLRAPTAAAELLLARGRPAEALTVLESTLGINGAADPAYGDTMLVRAAGAAADIAERIEPSGDVAAAQAGLERVVEARRRLGPPFAGAGANRFDRAQQAFFHAERARLAGEPLRSVECWRRAVGATADAGCAYLRVEARYRLAESLWHAGRRVDGAVELRGAHREATAMGALALARAMEALARPARVDLGDPQPPRVTAASPRELAALTAREREVLGHLLAGRSYAEIARELLISQKTVSVHVSNLLHKTGTPNRTAAAIWARDHGVG